MITLEQLNEAFPDATEEDVTKYYDAFIRVFDEYEINTPKRQAAFIAQVAHESGQLRHVVENLNYSAQGLLKIFKKYFTSVLAQEYARQPQRIANRVYANRMGNGPESSGDGWKHRGRGLIQLTGKNNSSFFLCRAHRRSIISITTKWFSFLPWLLSARFTLILT